MVAVLQSVTRTYVLQAIELFTELGRDGFLARHGFRRDRSYFVLHGGVAYDAKPIAGVAVELMSDWPAALIPGGRAVADPLRALGFDVVEIPDWQLEETILACDLLARNDWVPIAESDVRVAELSQLLRTQWDFAQYLEELRSPGSVHHKLEDLRTARPGHLGAAKRGGSLTRQVAAAFVSDPERMHALATALRSMGRLAEGDADMDLDEVPASEPRAGIDVVSAAEGKVIRRLVNVRERNPKLRAEKIAQSREQRHDIACEVCGFDFEQTYGSLGDGFVHVHHRVPLHFSGEVESTIDDLVLLCANCHQMIHRGRPQWLTPEQLRAVLDRQRVSGA
ncbi:HNH endonuclease [Nocardia sp. NPDC051981]|uniref:HNH endonuclease n=1 Tax=Nocardia sp. NPDC051981 TaxID=3155417 RepID=UPI003418829D